MAEKTGIAATATASDADGGRDEPLVHAPESSAGIQSMADAFRQALAAGDVMKPEKAAAETIKPSEKAEKVEKQPEAEAKKEERKPDETAAEAEEVLTKPWRRSADWKALKSEKESALAEVVKLKEELARRTAAPELTEYEAKLEKLQRERDEYDARLKQVAVEKHPGFQSYFTQNIQAAIDSAKAAIPDAARAAELEMALKMDDSAQRDDLLVELTSELSEVKRNRVFSHADRIVDLNRERAAELSNWKKNYDKITAQESQGAVERKKQLETVFDSTLKRIAESNELMTEIPGNDKWNAGVRERREQAKALFSGQNSPDVLAEAAVRAAMLPVYETYLHALTTKVKELQGALKARSNANPGVNGNSAVSAGEARPVEDFVDRVMREMRGT